METKNHLIHRQIRQVANNWSRGTKIHEESSHFIVPCTIQFQTHTIHQDKRQTHQPPFNNTNAILTEGKGRHSDLHHDESEKWNGNIYGVH